MEFRDLISSSPLEVTQSEEARFSFFSGGYVEDVNLQGKLSPLFGIQFVAMGMISSSNKCMEFRFFK